jgi:eukaryotic-like serine/threonine-protein kinase
VRARRHVAPSGLERLRSVAWGRFGMELGLIVVVALIGFGVSSSWVNPGPVLGSDHAVPRVIEMPEAEAKAALTKAGFKPRVDAEWPNPGIPRGAVLWQDPPPDMVLPPNTTVELVVSAGPPPVAVPDVVGLAEPFAEKIIEAAGIKVGSVDTVHGGVEPGVVIATRPPTGQGRQPGTPVDLVVSSGPTAAAP